MLSDLSEALNKTTRPILSGKINATTSTLVSDLANITSSLKPVALSAASANDKNNNTSNSKTNQDIDKIKSIIKLEEKFKKNIDLFQKEINSCQHLEAISMEFISNEKTGQKNLQQPSTSTKITKTKTSTNNSTKTTTTTTTTITKNASGVDSKTTTVSKQGKNSNTTSQDESSTSVKKLRSSSSSSSSNLNNAKMSTSPVKILKELAKSKDKKYSEVKRMIEDEKLAKELAIKLKEEDSDEYEDDDEEDDDDIEQDSDEDDEDSEDDDDDEDDEEDEEDEDHEYSQEFQNMSYNDHLITIIMKPPKGNQSIEEKMNSIHRNAVKSKAITSKMSSTSAAVTASSSNTKYKNRVKATTNTEEEEKIESTLSSLSLHGHLTNRKPSVEEILKTINSNDENIIFVQPFSDGNANNSKTSTSEATAIAATLNQQQRKTYRRKPVMQCTNVHCISSGGASCNSGGSKTTTTTTTSSTTNSNGKHQSSKNKDVVIESNTVIRLNSSPSRSGIVDLRDEKNASQLAFLLNLKNESQKSSVYNRLKAQASKPLQKLNTNSNETTATTVPNKITSNSKPVASVKGMKIDLNKSIEFSKRLIQ